MDGRVRPDKNRGRLVMGLMTLSEATVRLRPVACKFQSRPCFQDHAGCWHRLVFGVHGSDFWGDQVPVCMRTRRHE